MAWALPASEAERNTPETTPFLKAENSIAKLENRSGFSVFGYRPKLKTDR